MNRYKELLEGRTKIAVLGLNEESMDLALNLGENYSVLIGDLAKEGQMELDVFLSRKGFHHINTSGKSIELVSNASELRAAGVYYLNGITSSIMDWDSVKETANLIGRTLNAGDWVVFGAHIDPDMAEVVLIDILQSKSGLELGNGFEISFCPALIKTANFDNMSNEMKLSHNLIISEVEKIFKVKSGGEFGSNQINFRDPKQELNTIKAKVAQLWVPMLNDMTPGTFREFVDLAVNNSFLDAYNHLKMSNEIKVDWKRFFRLATRAGLNHRIEDIAVLSGLRQVG